MSDFKLTAEVKKIDDTLGVVFGWAIVCTEGGEPYFDLQGDHIPEDAMLAAAADFMENSAAVKEMHTGERVGSTLFAFPLTSEVAKAFGLDSSRTGLMIGVRPSDKGMLERFRSGELRAFSIGGQRIVDEVLEDD